MERTIFAEQEKRHADRLTRKTYQCGNSKQIGGTLEPATHHMEQTPLPGDKN